MNAPSIPAAVPAINEPPADDGPDVRCVTIITTTEPARVGKRFVLQRDGSLTKLSPPLSEGTAQVFNIATAEDFRAMIEANSTEPNKVLVPWTWDANETGEPFNFTTRERLASMLSRATGETITKHMRARLVGIHEINGARYAVRLVENVFDEDIVIFDFDKPRGMPEDMQRWSVGQAIESCEPFVPNISRCTRVDWRGSSSRVALAGEPPGPATHSAIFVKEPHMRAILREVIRIGMGLHGLTFPSPRFSRRPGEEGTVIGHDVRGPVDLAPLYPSGIVYIARPDLSAAPGYVDHGAGAVVVNPDGGELSIAELAYPTADDLRRYRDATGQALEYSSGSNGNPSSLRVMSRGTLTPDTEIETEEGVTTVREIFGDAGRFPVGSHIRCHTPFRASTSRAAFLRITTGGAYLHDVGPHVTHTLDASSLLHEHGRALRFALERIAGVPPEETERRWEAEVVASRERDARYWDVTPLRTHAVKVVKGDDLGDVDRAMAVLKGVRPRLFWRGRLVTAADVPMKFMQADGSTIERKVRGVQTVSAVALAPLLSGAADFYTERRATAKELAEAEAAALAQATTDNAPAPAAEAVTLPAVAPRPVMVKASIYVPPRICKAILEDRRLADRVPLLTGLSSLPIMNVTTGDIDTVRGYDPVSGFWIDGDSTITVPARPGRDDAVRALAVLRELEAGFPFATDVDRDTFVAGVVGAFIRASLPTLPGVFVTAPVSGTGKSHVTKTIGAASLGVIPAAMSWPNGKEEMDKHLDGLALAGVSTILLDNVNHRTFKSEKLEKFITEPTLEVRELGANAIYNVNTPGTLVLINGNDSEPHADMAQRLLQCRLDAAMENPRERVFAGDPLAAVIAQRARYAGAAMTMVRAYIHAGAPDAVGYASFEVWSRAVRSALIWSGGVDVLEGVREGVANDPEAEKRRRLLAFIRDTVFPTLPADARADWRFKSGHVDAAMAAAGVDGAALAVALGLDIHAGAGRDARLGQQLKAWSGMVATMDDGKRVRVVKAPRRSDGMWWRLQVMA